VTQGEEKHVKRTNRARPPRPPRGASLIEVLIAMAILAMLMVGILQLFSLALLTDTGAASRSDMTLRAQQVAENLRYLHFLRTQDPAAVPADTGLPTAPSNGLTVTLPRNGTTDTNAAWWPYWGPTGTNVMYQDDPPFAISYTYSASPTPNYWYVTVSVTSADAPAGMNYLGTSARVKRVDYVCQVPQ